MEAPGDQGGRDVGCSAAPDPIFGRDEEIAHVLAILDPAEARLVTLTGRGGVGKTRLATAAAEQLADAGRPLALVPLAGVPASSYVLAEIAHALGVTPARDVARLDAVVAALSRPGQVLVLDNFEHLLDGAPMVADLLERCPELQVLVTSQGPLKLRAERVIAIGPLPVPSPVDPRGDVGELVAQPAVATYLARARAVVHGFACRAEDLSDIVELCRRLDGLPLAIELAAARAATLSARDVLGLLDGEEAGGGLDLLHQARPDVPPRQRGLRAAIEWTYGLLSPDQQRLMRRLAVCTGSFDVDLVLDLDDGEGTAETLDRLGVLVDLHLLDPLGRPGPGRFTIPSTIRAFAAQELERSGEGVEVRARHVALRAEQARRAADADRRREVAGLAGRLEADRDDLLAALLHALDADRADDAFDLVSGLALCWDTRGYHADHEDLVERALALGERCGSDPLRLAHGLTDSAVLGLRHSSRLPTPTLVSRLERAEEIARSTDDALLIRVLTAWFLVIPATGEVLRAALAVGQAREVAARPGNEAFLPRLQVWAGMLANIVGDEEQAIELGLSALAEARRRGDEGTIVCAAMLLEPLRPGHPVALAEVPTSEETLETIRRIGMPFYEAIVLPRAMVDAAGRGDVASAARHAADALAMAKTMPGSPVAAFQVMGMVRLAAALGHHDRAAWFYGNVRSVQPEIRQVMTKPQIVLFDAVLDASRRALGDERFEAEAEGGAIRPLAAGIEEGMAYVESLAAGTADGSSQTSERITVDRLTPRQHEVLVLLAQGLSNKEIAGTLGLTPKSVMHHTTAVYQVLGARGRSEATAWAFRAGLVR